MGKAATYITGVIALALVVKNGASVNRIIMAITKSARVLTQSILVTRR